MSSIEKSSFIEVCGLIKQKLNKLLITGALACACSHSALASVLNSDATPVAAPTTTSTATVQNRSLAYLSCPFISTAEASDTPAEITNTGNSAISQPKKTFSPEQEALMQNLSKMINVSNGGVWLALKLPLSIR
jgi:hypothetical protein